jgi:hypothetical protein
MRTCSEQRSCDVVVMSSPPVDDVVQPAMHKALLPNMKFFALRPLSIHVEHTDGRTRDEELKFGLPSVHIVNGKKRPLHR